LYFIYLFICLLYKNRVVYYEYVSSGLTDVEIPQNTYPDASAEAERLIAERPKTLEFGVGKALLTPFLKRRGKKKP